MAASTHVITDATAVTNTPFTQASLTKSRTAAADNLDIGGMACAALAALTKARVLLTEVQNATDSADPNLTTIQNLLLTLS